MRWVGGITFVSGVRKEMMWCCYVVIAVLAQFGWLQLAASTSLLIGDSKVLAHVTILATNITNSILFYKKIGMVVDKNRPEMGFEGVWMMVPSSVPSVSIHLVKSDDPNPAGEKSKEPSSVYGFEHFAVTLSGSPNAVIEELRAQHIPICIGAPRPNDYIDQVFVSDPDGNVIEISARSAEFLTIRDLERQIASSESKNSADLQRTLNRVYDKAASTMVEEYRSAIKKYGESNAVPDPELKKSSTTMSIGKTVGAAFGNPLGTAAALDVLRRGGSAVDAVIAGNLVMAVVEPMNCGLGGDFFAMIHSDRSVPHHVAWTGSGFSSAHITSASMIAQLAKAGYDPTSPAMAAGGHSPIPLQGIFAASTVPAAMASWCHLHQAYGRLPWYDLFAKAIHYAMNGFPVSIHTRKNWDHVRRFVEAYTTNPQIFTSKQFFDFMRVFGVGSIGPLAGERYRNPILGKTLLELRQAGGCERFYGAMAADMTDYYARFSSPPMLSRGDFQAAWESILMINRTLSRGVVKAMNLDLRPAPLLAGPARPLLCSFQKVYSIYTVPSHSQAFAACHMLSLLQELDSHRLRVDKAYRLYAQVVIKRLVYAVLLTRNGGDNVEETAFSRTVDLGQGLLGLSAQQLRVLLDAFFDAQQPFPIEWFVLGCQKAAIDFYQKYVTIHPEVVQRNISTIGEERVPPQTAMRSNRRPKGSDRSKAGRWKKRIQALRPWSDSTAGDTVAMAVTDSWGMSISALQSLGGAFGSGVTVPSLGFVLQNRGSSFSLDEEQMHVNALSPRRRPLHTLSPWIVKRERELYAVLAIKGGDRQPYVFTQFLLNTIVLGLEAEAAVDAPRFRHVVIQDPSASNPRRHWMFLRKMAPGFTKEGDPFDVMWLRNTSVEIEPHYDLSTADVQILARLGISVKVQSPFSSFEDSGFGIIQTIYSGGSPGPGFKVISDSGRKPGKTAAA